MAAYTQFGYGGFPSASQLEEEVAVGAPLRPPSGAYSLMLSTWSSGGCRGRALDRDRDPGAWQWTQRYKSRLDRCVCDSQKFPKPLKLDWDSYLGSGIGTGTVVCKSQLLASQPPTYKCNCQPKTWPIHMAMAHWMDWRFLTRQERQERQESRKGRKGRNGVLSPLPHE
ncbi:hypothetical protein M5D96_005511 [Drosophila gunungcola]|uniref:Uncharacterized protein n=1 Tax=Drosophila gunungcola TaxID=103775 RepID=A0A9Q0BRI8_9MUSC|nr:hypothetical protein M5D96_005511 [Drosophila gunungcola]